MLKTSRSLVFAVALAVSAVTACGTTTGMGGPTMNNRLEASAPEPDGPAIQSNDILGRDPVTRRAMVQHVLIGFPGLEAAYGGRTLDPRAAGRTREQADALALEVLQRTRAGEDFPALMRTYSEDTGSAATGESYEVTPDAGLVFEFKRLSLRLKVGEAGLVLTQFGWHVIKRIE